LVKWAQAAWNVEAIGAYHDAVIETIGEAVRGAADRNLAERAMAALQDLAERRDPRKRGFVERDAN
jgi:hypothetical protein